MDEMRQPMMWAEVGGDTYGEDSSSARLVTHRHISDADAAFTVEVKRDLAQGARWAHE